MTPGFLIHRNCNTEPFLRRVAIPSHSRRAYWLTTLPLMYLPQFHFRYEYLARNCFGYSRDPQLNQPSQAPTALAPPKMKKVKVNEQFSKLSSFGTVIAFLLRFAARAGTECFFFLISPSLCLRFEKALRYAKRTCERKSWIVSGELFQQLLLGTH